MVLYNAATKELTAKIVYYGPGLCGKTTNLQLLHDRLDPKTVGNLVTLSTQADRTIYFDLLPVELGEIKGYRIRFQLATVPGQTAFNETRKVVLRGADGIVFVADSRWAVLPKNLESWQNLKDNLKANGLSFETIPIVIQYNKRDLEDILSVEAMQEALGFSSYPFVEAVASAGRGITETFRLVSKLTFVDLLRRLQGRRPEEAAASPTGPTLILASPQRSAPQPAPQVEASEAKGGLEAASLEGTPPSETGRAAGAADRLAAFQAHLAAIEKELEARAEQWQPVARSAAETAERLAAAERRLEAQEEASAQGQQRVEATLASLSTRGEKLYQEIAATVRRLEILESSLQEKTAQGRREAEDIRSQIAPLLEANAERRASDGRILAEFDRLRESLADSLAEVSDRLRRAVREL